MWLLNSSIGRKLVMSISGLFLILFLLFHMSMNCVAIFSGEAYNQICEFLGANWYALVGTGVLAAGVIVHLVCALILTAKNRAARGQEYAYRENPKGVSLASQNMLVLGAIILIGLCVHLSHFWAKMQLPEVLGAEAEYAGQFTDGAALIKATFSSPLICVLYLLWFAAIWFHLTHGFWSAFQTMGLNNNTWLCRLKVIANVVATIIFLGFAAVVIAGYFQCGGLA